LGSPKKIELSYLLTAKGTCHSSVNRSITKHIDIQHQYVHDIENLGAIQFEYISTKKMVVDMLTKAIPREKHSWCMKILGLDTF
jgi:hypothetical protein